MFKQPDNTKIILDSYKIYLRRPPTSSRLSFNFNKSILNKDIFYKCEYNYIDDSSVQLVDVIENLRVDYTKHSIEQYEHGQLMSLMEWHVGGILKLIATFKDSHFIETEFYPDGKTKTIYTYNYLTNREMNLTFNENGQLNI